MSRTYKILIIEDELMLSQVYSSVLGLSGYAVEVANNGLQGLAVLSSFQPDLILLDLLMPEMDGITFLQNFDNNAYKRTKIIVNSNLYDNYTVERVTALGATDVVLKSSMSPKDMVAMVRRHLGQSISAV